MAQEANDGTARGPSRVRTGAGEAVSEAHIETREQLHFAVFCIEGIAEHLGKDARDVYSALADESDILDGYIARYYDALHTQDKLYIVDDVLRELDRLGVRI